MVQQPVTIKRIDPDRDPHSYSSLRQVGIEQVQALSGNDWTDYNIHDPGVTILEQLCYQLSELLYRSEFAVEDFIVDLDGQLDLPRQGLAVPHQIFPCRPSSTADLREVIVSSILDLDNAWVDMDDGIAQVSVCIRSEAESEHTAIIDNVRKICHRNRNLCEDFDHNINVIPRRQCALHADIEIAQEERLSNILGEIYAIVHRHVAGRLRYRSFRRALNAGQQFEQIFSGPLLATGIVSDESLAATEYPVQIVDLLSLVGNVEGVARVHDLFLSVDGVPHKHSLRRFDGESYLALVLPDAASSPIHVTAHSNGRVHTPKIPAVIRCIDELLYSDDASQRSQKSIRALYDIPVGRNQDFAQYTPVQELLPPVYGISHIGSLSSARPEQSARLRQLMAFLSIFDQTMADFAAGLGHIRDLYSIDPAVDRSYVCRTVDNDALAETEFLHDEPQPAFLEKLTRRGDNFADRRNRVLNYLLALYGETFPDSALKSCMSYATDDRLSMEIIHCKLIFLRNISRLTRNRGAAFDYTRLCWETLNISGIQARLSLMLNLSELRERSLLRPLLDLGVRLIAHDDYLETRAGRVAITDLEIGDDFQPIPGSLDAQDVSMRNLRQRARELGLFREDELSDALIRSGTRLTSYRLGPLPDNPGLQLLFQPTPGSSWWLIASVPDRQSGIETAHGLRSLLQDINRRCEGMHIVEHVLLRPTQAKVDPVPMRVTCDSSFLHNRLTIVMPNWTLRFHDAGFRMLAEELTRLHCPAHISPEILWLSYDEMYRFEGLYSLWLKKRGERPHGSVEIDEIADELALFIRTRHDYAPDTAISRHYV